MCILAIISVCIYTGDQTECTGADVMIVGDKLESITQREFYGWKTLVNVTFPPNSDLKSIGAYSFYQCSNLRTINFPSKLESIGTYAFGSCTSLTAIHLPVSLATIGVTAFNACSKLTTITADENIQVKSLESHVFGSTPITTFAIWKNLVKISGGAFDACLSFEEFTNPHDNPTFNIVDGVLYSGTALNLMPAKRSGHFVVPRNTTVLMVQCFRHSRIESISFEAGSQMATFEDGCMFWSHIHSFEFPDNELVTAISATMFYCCKNLRTLSIPDCVTSIGESAFFLSELEFLNVSASHPTFTCVSGALFSKTLSEIVAVPPKLDVEKFVIPKNVKSIAVSAFRSSSIPIIEFEPGSSLESLGDYAFSTIVQSSFGFDPDCPLTNIPNMCFESSAKLATIELPRHLKSIDGSAFSNTGLIEFIIPEDAEHLVSIDGVLYSFDRTILYRFPPAKTDANYAVPSSVQTVGSSAFATCKGISTLAFASDSRLQNVQKSAFASSTIITVVFGDKSDDVTFDEGCFTSSSVQYVTLPGRMRVIKTNMFKDCFDLVGITLPETATSIEVGAFTNCEKLSKLSIPRFCTIRNIPVYAFTNTKALTELELPFLVETIAANSLPANLRKLTLWCPLTPSVVEAARVIPTLRDVYILCGLSLNTTAFVSPNVVVHHICFTKKQRRLGVGKPFLVATILSVIL